MEALRRRCLDNIELVNRLLQKFSDELAREIPQLEHQLLIEDWNGLWQTTHRLKGESANLSAEPLRETFSDMNAGCMSHDHDSLGILLLRLKNEQRELRRFLEPVLNHVAGR
jgi:HPt (histidine-containing phosphotransfer) domain-containing protein